MDKLDYKKEYKDLYLPKKKAALIDVPAMNFITVDGRGLPASKEYENAMQCLLILHDQDEQNEWTTARWIF